MWLVGADRFHDLCNFRCREPVSEKRRGRLFHRVADIIPAGKFLRIFGPMTDEHAQVMKPCRGVNDVVIVGHAFTH